ncbi:MAG: BON domain-containing protein [Rhizobacter sp.]|nr:BON domain-containing protein [Rhizobacter sp.]
MKSQPTLKLTTLAALASAAFLVACSDSQQTAGQKLDQTVATAQEKGAELKSEAKQATAELKDQAASMAASATQTVGDAAITTEVNASLAKDAALRVMEIDVDTVQGRVTLSGTAPDAAAMQRATQLAQAVDGVKAVDNRLVVK